MRIYEISKEEKKKGLKKLSKINQSKKKDVKKESKREGFSNKHDYYISFQKLAESIKYGDVKNDNGLYYVDSPFIRVKKGKHPNIEKHENVPAKYLACVVSPFMSFNGLEKRGVKIKERDDGQLVYFIPLKFVCSLLPKKYSFTVNISTDLFEMEIFKYTGNIFMLLPLSIFNISSEIYLTAKASVDDQDIRVLV